MSLEHRETLHSQKDLEESSTGGFICLFFWTRIYYSYIIFIIIQEV